MTICKLSRALPLLVVACGAAPAASDSDVETGETSPSAESALKAKNDLSAPQQQNVLDMLNDVCGDTWCEGNFEWDFQRISCGFSARSCTLTIKVVEPKVDADPERVFWRSCKVSGLTNYKSLVETFKNGNINLQQTFYEKVDVCVTRLESHILEL